MTRALEPLERMTDVAGLAMPFFGLIFLGYACGRLMLRGASAGLEWFNVYIVYVAVPALYFTLISKTPFEELANVGFIAITTGATLTVFVLSLAIGYVATRNLAEATITGAAGSYSNVGYMGPGLTLAALGPAAAAPTALIFVFDCTLLFTLVPFLMSLAGSRRESFLHTAALVAKRVALHPFNIATVVGGLAAYFHYAPPKPVADMIGLLSGSAAPCALFVMGVTVALRPLKTVPLEMPALLAVKLILHPLIVYAALTLIGGFDRVWIATAVLMASLPPALNIFVMASQYDTYVDRASGIVLVGTLISVVTVTGVLYVIVHGGLF